MFDCGQRAQYMDGQRERFMRLEESSPRSVTSDTRCGPDSFGSGWGSDNPIRSLLKGMRRGSSRLCSLSLSLPFITPRPNYANDPRNSKNNNRKIVHPQDKFLLRMNRAFVMSVIVAVAVDPLFLYLPLIDFNSNCISIDRRLAITSTLVRSFIDLFYVIRIVLQFRTAYYATSARGGTGELITDPARITRRYLRSYFILDLFAVLPFPQIVIWRYLHSIDGSKVQGTKDALLSIIVIQFFPRFFRLYPLTSDLKRTTGVFIETAWAGATYYLLWFMLAGHNVGTFWYLLTIEREDNCWQTVCSNFKNCTNDYLYCGNQNLMGYDTWLNASGQDIATQCNFTSNSNFNFGIFAPALQTGIVSSHNFVSKASYCFWWGLRSLSTLGQGLQTSIYPGEVIFSIAICVVGLILFALLIGNMQTYLQSLTIRSEEMRVKKQDAEQWMHHRLLPPHLKERVRRYEQYKWLETRGVDEEGLVQNLPKDLRRDIKRHLCLGLVKRVPLFANMDERLLDAICVGLKPSLYTENAYILKEGEPVNEMLFIIRGCLESITTDGGRTGFFNRSLLKEGAFCGEELLTWALDPKSASNLPTSTRTVRALNKVEGFALVAEELRFVASQFRRLHSREVRHTFRYHSQHWRTWAARFIQAAWRRHCKRKLAEIRRKEESSLSRGRTSLGATIYASRFAANALRGVYNFRNRGGGGVGVGGAVSGGIVRLQKPPEPDFSVDVTD